MRNQLITSSPKLSTILIIAAIFGTVAFLYSIIGFFNNQPTSYRVNVYGSVSPQEVAGHFLFGYIVALPTRNLKLGILAGLMALAIDADHILAAAGFQISIRLSHSILFAIIASILIGLAASRIFERQSSGTELLETQSLVRSSVGVGKDPNLNPAGLYDSRLSVKAKLFFQFLVLTLAAYMSHIAYDVFVDTRAVFPLLSPFNFHEVLIPQIYGLPIEGAAILMVYLWYAIKDPSEA